MGGGVPGAFSTHSNWMSKSSPARLRDATPSPHRGTHAARLRPLLPKHRPRPEGGQAPRGATEAAGRVERQAEEQGTRIPSAPEPSRLVYQMPAAVREGPLAGAGTNLKSSPALLMHASHVHAHAHTHARAYRHIRAHIHTHTQSQSSSCWARLRKRQMVRRRVSSRPC